MYSEFCKILEDGFECEYNQLPNINEYDIIEYVYTWYPVELTKNDYARIWMTAHPMNIIYDMLPRAKEAEKLQMEIDGYKDNIQVAVDKLAKLKSPDMEV